MDQAATSGHHVASLLLPAHTHRGHPLITSGTRPPADNCSDKCPESPASSILRFDVGRCIEMSTTQSAVWCAINFLLLQCLPELFFCVKYITPQTSDHVHLLYLFHSSLCAVSKYLGFFHFSLLFNKQNTNGGLDLTGNATED